MNITNDCTQPKGRPLIHVFAEQQKSPSRIREEKSILSRMDKIYNQIFKWRKQKNAYLDEEFFDRFFLAVVKIEDALYSFPGAEDYDSRKYYS